MCARTLECGHSEALATRGARTGSSATYAGDQIIFIDRQRPEATLEQTAGLPSPRIEVPSKRRRSNQRRVHRWPTRWLAWPEGYLDDFENGASPYDEQRRRSQEDDPEQVSGAIT
jgi:hypothetical protein